VVSVTNVSLCIIFIICLILHNYCRMGLVCGCDREQLLHTVFPSLPELLRMVKWGVVQSKFQNAKLQIEERMVDNEVHYILPKVWVQFTGLPPQLRDYLIICAVGSILGVTKEVDMVFTS
jgi:hypothetical protein